jgi:proteasome lid subunit RPN8/RPN11
MVEERLFSLRPDRTGVSRPPPARVSVPWRSLVTLRRIFAAAAPEEGCALLLARRSLPSPDGDRPVLEGIWPCRNVWHPASGTDPAGAPDRTRRFRIDPREQIHAQRWGRRRGLTVLGHAHSHPGTPPRPSPSDLAQMADSGLMLIWTLGLPAAAGLRGWWFHDAQRSATGPAARPGPSPEPVVLLLSDRHSARQGGVSGTVGA